MNHELIVAAEQGDIAAVTALLNEGADINGTDERGRTAVLAATHGNQPEAVKKLIAAGADLNLRDHRSDNPLLYAGAEGMPEIVKLAVEAGADTALTNRYGGTALIPAADRGHVEIVQYLLEHSDVKVDHINNLGWTALLEAVLLGDGGERHTQIVRLLIEHGADVNLADKDGVTPLAHAESRGYADMAALLKDAGAH
ncbi:ankyrin repeat domain-containing protein [Paenibacillus tengchongensis]|uniref:ankyrin repeat domain-containing protein n=1 Tax=Paenibacillus tengchongensis TaxID=2608684 RepID=UPI001FEAA378|nr:ankyrin repeat domain-containing protein [Paenibacillus tengchongensis]